MSEVKVIGIPSEAKSEAKTTAPKPVKVIGVNTQFDKDDKPIDGASDMQNNFSNNFTSEKVNFTRSTFNEVSGFSHNNTNPLEIRAQNQSSSQKYWNSAVRIPHVAAAYVVEVFEAFVNDSVQFAAGTFHKYQVFNPTGTGGGSNLNPNPSMFKEIDKMISVFWDFRMMKVIVAFFEII